MDAQATFSCSFTQSDLEPSRGTAQSAPLAGPEAASPATAGSGSPGARRSSTRFRLGPGI